MTMYLGGKEIMAPPSMLGSGSVEGRYSAPGRDSSVISDALITGGLIKGGMEGAMMSAMAAELLGDE